MQRARGVNRTADVPSPGSSCRTALLQEEAALGECACTLPPSPVPHTFPNQLRVRIEVRGLPKGRYLSYCALRGTFPPGAQSSPLINVRPRSKAHLILPRSLSQAFHPADGGPPTASTARIEDEHRPADSTPATTGVVENPHPPPDWNLPASSTVTVASREPLQLQLRAVGTRQQVEGMRVIDDFEFVHTNDCIHADVKASILFFSFGKGNENKAYLVEFSLACRYTQNGKHREYKEDLRNAHDYTVEFTGRDAHIGAHSQKGDMKFLGYNLIQWLCWRLPWEDNLKDTEYVSQQKGSLMENIHLLMRKCTLHGDIACGITWFLQYVASLKFEDIHDYKRLKMILEKGIQAVRKPNGELLLPPPRTPRHHSCSQGKPVLQEIILAHDSASEHGDEHAVRKPPPAKVSRGGRSALVRKNLQSPATTKSASSLGSQVMLVPEGRPVKNGGV